MYFEEKTKLCPYKKLSVFYNTCPKILGLTLYVRTSKWTSSNSNAPFTQAPPQIAHKTCHKLQMSDVCRVQFPNNSCLGNRSVATWSYTFTVATYSYTLDTTVPSLWTDWLSVSSWHKEQERVPWNRGTLTAALRVPIDTCRTAYTWYNICSHFCLFHKVKIVPS
jgi:hypothetical protein